MHWLLTSKPIVALSTTIWFSGPQLLLAQTGTTKTAIGWGIVLLCIGLGLLVVCRPSVRNPIEKKKAKKKK